MQTVRNVKQVIMTVGEDNTVHVQTGENGMLLVVDQVGEVVIHDKRTPLRKSNESNAEYIAKYGKTPAPHFTTKPDAPNEVIKGPVTTEEDAE